MVNKKSPQAPQKSNRGKVLKVLARLATTGIISFGIGGAVTFDRYNNYWNQTIFRVQTVDFNILSHTLPTKLSYAIIKNEPEEVQRTLDSNYSLFGLIVTDSSGQKIIAYSGKNSGRFLSWKAALDPQQLQNHPYDVLLDPPPVFPQWTYSEPKATERSATSFTNQGRVIGRVYYVRGVRPTFQEDIMTLLKNPFSDSSRIQTYTISLIACFGGTLLVWSILEFILYKKRVGEEKARRELELAQAREEIAKRKIELAQFESELAKKSEEKAQQELELAEIRADKAELAKQNAQREAELIEERRQHDLLIAEEKAQRESELAEQKRLRDLKEAEKEKQRQLQELIDNNQALQVQLEERINELGSLKKQRDVERSQFEEEANNLRNLNSRLQEEIFQLTESLKYLSNASSAKLQTREKELKNKLENLRKSLREYELQEDLLKKRAEQAQAESERLNEEMERYKEEMGKHPLNNFELAIKKFLENNFFNSRIEIQFDVANRREVSKFTDFILITRQCCIIIEAKSYQGVIKPLGDVRNAGWICQKEKQKLNIYCSWGKNPYKQLKAYCDSLMKNGNLSIQLGIQDRVPVYGLVVFPVGSNIDDSIQSDISDNFYRVTTLDKLTTTIQELDNQAKSWK